MTTREIEPPAGGGKREANKRDLLFLVANDLLDRTRRRAEGSISRERPLLENYVSFCAFHFRTHEADPDLSKLILRELLFYDSGVQAIRSIENRALLLKNLQSMLQIASDNGEIRLTVTSDVVARVLFAVFQAEIRHWLANADRELLAGLDRLWTSASLVVNGVAIVPVESNAKPSVLRAIVKSLDRRVTPLTLLQA